MSEDGRVFNASTHKVLTTLQAASGEKGACLSVGELAKIIDRSESTVRRALKTLTEVGTIKTLRHDGAYRNGGITNCYQVDTPLPVIDGTPLPKSDNPLSVISDTPLSGNDDTPLPFDTPLPSSTVEYVSAAGEKESLSLKAKESVLSENDTDKDKQTNSLKPIEISATPPVNSLADDFNAASPEERELAIQAYTRANPEPEPEVSQEVQDAYFKKWAYSPVGLELEALQRIVKKHGQTFVLKQIADASLVDKKQKRIQNPARFIETTLENMAAKGELPVPALAPAKQSLKQADDFDPFNRDGLPNLLERPTSAPIDPNWQRLLWAVQGLSSPIHNTLRECQFGGVKDSILTVIAPTTRIFNDCYRGMRHNRWLYRQAHSIWDELQDVEFIQAGVDMPPGGVENAHPEAG